MLHGVGGNGGPRYRDRSTLATRASAAEAHPGDDGPTTLDRPRLVRPARPESSASHVSLAANTTHRMHEPASQFESERRAPRLSWFAIVAIGALTGIVGTLFGAWLTTRGW